MRLSLRLLLCLGVGAGCSNAAVGADGETGETGGGTGNGSSPGTSDGSVTSGLTDAGLTDVSSIAGTMNEPPPDTGTEEGTSPDPPDSTGEVLTSVTATTGTTGGTTDPVESTGTTDGTTTADDSTTSVPFDGCGLAADPGAQERMIDVAGTQRHYIVVIPPGYDPNKAYPLVFAWHGLGGSGMLARQYFQIEQASQGEAIFVYPDGLPQPMQGNQSGWDLMDGGVDVQFFDAMLADLTATTCVDQARVFSAGHSFGGYMSNALGCYRGGVVRAIGLVAGGGPYGMCSGQVAAWLAHGTFDAVVPIGMGTLSRDHWTMANGCDMQADPVDPPPCTAYAGCDAQYPVHWCQHQEPDFMGHGWPTWAGAGIWQFFAGL